MQQNNRASNARYLGPIVFGEIKPANEDQYQQMPPLFVEDTPKKPNPDELSDQDLSAQKTQNLNS
jgi:hypothetical protein